MKLRLTTTAIAVAAVFPLSVPVASAQDSRLDTVVVTATRFESVQQTQPIAAQVITAEEISNSSATTVGEVLNKLGGVNTRSNLNGTPDSSVDLRGFGVTGNQNTLILVDGQRISENELAAARISAIPLDSIERIEILRGSGAVLYGGGATGGTINIITRSAINAPFSGNVSTRLGSHDLRDVRGGIRAGGEMWGLRLNAQHYRTDNYRDNNRVEQNAASGEFRLGDSDGFIAFAFNADKQNSRLPGARTEALLRSDRRGTATPDDFTKTESQRLSLRGEKRIGDVILALDIGRRDKRAKMFTDSVFGSSLMRADIDVTAFSPRVVWQTVIHSVENKLTIGADYSRWSYANDTFGTGFMSSLDESGRQRNRGIYLRDDIYFPATGTRLILGGRKESVSQSLREQLLPRDTASRTHHLSAYEISLQQELAAGFSVYGRIGRSFRVANIDENRCFFGPCPSLLKPQRSNDREIGAQWQGRSASFAATLFTMDVDDEIHYNALTFSNMNLSPTRHRGLELEGKVFIGDTIDVAARYTRTQARFRKGIYGGVDVAGNDVPLVPRDRIGLNIGWQVMDSTRLGLDLTYTGRQRYDNDQANRFRKMPSYTIVDTKLTHDVDAWRFTFGINNLLDKKYFSYGVVNGTFTTFNAYPEARRNVYASAEYRF